MRTTLFTSAIISTALISMAGVSAVNIAASHDQKLATMHELNAEMVAGTSLSQTEGVVGSFLKGVGLMSDPVYTFDNLDMKKVQELSILAKQLSEKLVLCTQKAG